MRMLLGAFCLLVACEAPAGADDFLTADAIKTRFVGNTLKGTYPEGKQWAEYYSPEGEIRGHDDIGGSYSGRFTFRGDEICFDFDDTDQDFCGPVSDGAEGIRFYRNGKMITDIGHVILMPGNPNNL
ncbi:hypothetical protein [Dongia sedimenti]|uniref:MORN repeat protein n=1 Tax=Dongia sedimenti TaxID=3064282 RepID=A0ABU0YJM1_9PROT|nr:hypothetical protein [Rhodospirillaceae bacterium R-7]